MSYFSKQQAVGKGMKESNRLFSKCLGNMNSEKKRISECSGNVITTDTSNIKSFKALKIQMI